jgi:AhpD family alkylhydroperoxidase
MNSYDDFLERRAKGNKKISEQEFLPYNRFLALDSRAYEDGTVPVKYKEMMGLTASLVLRCNDCITYHLDRCIEEGAGKEELNEALNIGLIVGGSIIIPHLRFALEQIELIFEKKK